MQFPLFFDSFLQFEIEICLYCMSHRKPKIAQSNATQFEGKKTFGKKLERRKAKKGNQRIT